ncbi:MAG: hypothetical protein KF709_07705 [Gemmatimonadaceae bacterium]|nr:hypothetical protein [Gemmatimonadaceae bacterium]
MSERRFSDDEVAAIFARATEVRDHQPKALVRSEGMSLGELQAIGVEAGISAELIARAAREIDQPSAPPVPTLLGLPIGAAHTVELPRALTDREWELFVVQLRETFDAQGKVSSHGSFRQWQNGHLQVLVEPSGNGQRVRFKTDKRDTKAFVAIGASMAGFFGLMAFGVSFVNPEKAVRLASVLTPMVIAGAAYTGFNLSRIPGWRRLRSSQMQRLGDSLLALTSGSDSSQQG